MSNKPSDIDSLAQATAKGFSDVDRQFKEVHQRFDGLETRMDGLETRMDKLESGQAAILNVVQSIDQRLNDWQDIPERVAKLEEDVTELSLRR